jgi:uncharacterized protein YqgC (DUF456 family)
MYIPKIILILVGIAFILIYVFKKDKHTRLLKNICVITLEIIYIVTATIVGYYSKESYISAVIGFFFGVFCVREFNKFCFSNKDDQKI